MYQHFKIDHFYLKANVLVFPINNLECIVVVVNLEFMHQVKHLIHDHLLKKIDTVSAECPSRTTQSGNCRFRTIFGWNAAFMFQRFPVFSCRIRDCLPSFLQDPWLSSIFPAGSRAIRWLESSTWDCKNISTNLRYISNLSLKSIIEALIINDLDNEAHILKEIMNFLKIFLINNSNRHVFSFFLVEKSLANINCLLNYLLACVSALHCLVEKKCNNKRKYSI